ncbi:DALR anticodon-binding domain-containing protein 3 isoform X2 [Narcine bancroftii]|uniref:DALR anticodon-binding domain-containing protein 3 isoform X2 n=1 Tax=Narcine bancroftii TaxID=1343680 RepID=UPI003831941C
MAQPWRKSDGRVGPGPEFSLAGCAAALEAVLGGGTARVWFKESSGRNLRFRDWIAPRGALSKLYPQGQVPEDLMERLLSEYCHHLYIHNCVQTGAGLVIHLDHPALFKEVLSNLPFYTRPLNSVLPKKKCIILNCMPLHGSKGPETLTINHLRAILLADHLAELLRLQGYVVRGVPNLQQNAASCNFLRLIGVNWTTSQRTSSDNKRISDFKKILSESIYTQHGQLEAPPDQIRNKLLKGVQYKVDLKQFIKDKELEGYDTNLDVALVKEEALRQIAELQHTILQGALDQCLVIHVVGCEEEFQQQKIDVLWRILNREIEKVTQLQDQTPLQRPDLRDLSLRHLVCGPVKIMGKHSQIGAVQYFEFRRSQMLEASVVKYGNKVQGDSWSQIINSMTSAVIRFELLATAHRNPLNLDLAQGVNISTKGTKSGAFVMYNCARLATLFHHFNNSVEKGLYPHFPEISQLNFSALREEVSL